MKRRYFILPLVAGAVSLNSCDKEVAERGEEVKNESREELTDGVSGEATEGSTVAAVAKVEEDLEEVAGQLKEVTAPLVGGTVDHLAEKTGFAKYLPKDTAGYFGFYNGADLVKKARGGKLGAFLDKAMAEGGESFDDWEEDPSFQQFSAVAGEEVFLAVGANTAKQSEQLMVVSDRSNYYQMRYYVDLLGKVVSGNMDPEAGLAGGMGEMGYLIDLLKDEKSLAAFQEGQMPPIYAGFKVSDAEKRQMFVEQIQSVGDMIMDGQEAEVLKVLESKVGDHEFAGVHLDGELVAKQITGDAEAEFIKAVGAENVEAYKKAAAEKDIVMLAGEVDDYVLIFIGSDAAELKLAAGAEESVLAREDISFAKNYASKDLVSLLFVEKELQETIVGQESMEQVALGIKDGFQQTDVFGDTRVLEALLDDLGKRAEAVASSYEAARLGGVAFIEEGFKAEWFGGSNAPAFDLKGSRRLAGLGNKEDVLFFANWVADPSFAEKQFEFVDALGETAYQLTKHASEMDIEDAGFGEFSEGFKMMDGKFREDLLELWSAVRVDLNQGLGAESAFVVDINGEMPTVPEVPKAIIDKGKIPRLSYVSTVKDRAKLGESWEKINRSAESMLAKISEMTETELPMQRPFRNSNDGLASYTFPIPTTHQNATPTVVVSDELFFVASSPDFTTELAGRYKGKADAAGGATMIFDFDALRAWGQGWVELLDSDGKEILGDEEAFTIYQEQRPMIEDFFKAMEELDHLKVDTRVEDGELRSSLHFKVRE